MEIWLGGLIGAVIGLVIVLVCFVIAANRKGNLDITPQRSEVLSTRLPPDEAMRRLEARAPVIGLKVDQVDRDGGRILLSEGASFSSFGHFFPISVAPADSGAAVTVGLKPKIPQYGPVVGRNHRKILSKVRDMLAAD